MKITYEELKRQSKDIEFSHFKIPNEWFAFLDHVGWTGAEVRAAADQARAAKGETPLRPCAMCKRHHDTLAVAKLCKSRSNLLDALCEYASAYFAQSDGRYPTKVIKLATRLFQRLS